MHQTKTHRVRAEYDRLAETYDQRWGHYIDATLQATLDGLKLVGNERILDVPVGTGQLAAKLRQQWPELQIAGVDLSPRMLQQAAAKLTVSTESDSVPELHEGCVTDLPFQDNAFDCVFCVNSFHYFPDPQAALSEVRRVLRDSGRLILVDWCDDYWVCKLCSVWLRLVDPAFHRMYGQRECETLIRNAGFERLKSHRFTVGRIWGLMRFEAS